MTQKKVTIYTDGACSGNPGVGGWGAILMYGEAKKELSGAEQLTTNNRMEIMAAIAALKCLNQPCTVELYSDSAYLVNAFNEHYRTDDFFYCFIFFNHLVPLRLSKTLTLR